VIGDERDPVLGHRGHQHIFNFGVIFPAALLRAPELLPCDWQSSYGMFEEQPPGENKASFHVAQTFVL